MIRNKRRVSKTSVSQTSSIDEKYALRALELAGLGIGLVSPGPLVGCVIADSAGNLVGEGTYVYDEVEHAEVRALRQAGESAKGGTAYVSLEPHAHTGRTKPCTKALYEAGIRRVVCPCEDPNPLVSGRGFAELEEMGLEVSKGLLREVAETLNEKFFHWHRAGRPFVHLKLATSIDGRIATKTGESKWITGAVARERGQALRHGNDAILVGVETILGDDPSLTDRSGLPRRRPLVRIVLDSTLRIDPKSKAVLSAREVPLVVFAGINASLEKRESLAAAGVEVIQFETERPELQKVLDELRLRDLQGILVEGGGKVAGSMIDERLVDKVSFFVAPKIIGGVDAVPAVGGNGIGKMTEAVGLESITCENVGDDFEITGYPVYRQSLGETV
ncbi:MAG: bifunctional diaminohydroxyphosphoribosylaminopyrimidine deaminase/5-amino-6-(5-phosphoribosylamino)uracil reductase RibD [Pyrinomonadaceae bacterium]